MKSLLFILLFSITCTSIFGQKKRSVTVKAGENIMHVLSTSDVFQYPTFTTGTVVHMDGTTTTAQLNYNRLVDEMHFIGPRGDTLALANEEIIRFIAINKDTFFFNDGGYVRIIADGGRAKLAVKQIWVISDSKQVGAFNNSNTSASVVSLTSYAQRGNLYDMVVDADIVIKKIERFYLSNNSNHFILANKRNVLVLFPEWDHMEVYMKENKIDFTDERDLTKLTSYLAGVR